MSSNDDITPERINQFVWGFAPPLLLEVAVRHRVFDLLDEGPRTVTEVAALAGGTERGWRAVLEALAGLKLLTNHGDGRFTTSPDTSKFLVTTKPTFMGGILKHISRQLMPAWMQLDEIVLSGQPARRVNSDEGKAFFTQFVSDIFPMSYPGASALGVYLAVGAATSPLRVLDLAAGSGVWGIALAQQSKQVHVNAVDWEPVLEVTKKTVERFGLGAQFEYTASDILEAAYADGTYDIATLGHIIHSEGEARSRALLQKLHAGLKPGGTIAIGEFTPNAERTGPPHTLIFAVNMVVNTEAGNTYTFEEISAWLKEAGFADVVQVPCPGPSPLIVAKRV